MEKQVKLKLSEDEVGYEEYRILGETASEMMALILERPRLLGGRKQRTMRNRNEEYFRAEHGIHTYLST